MWILLIKERERKIMEEPTSYYIFYLQLNYHHKLYFSSIMTIKFQVYCLVVVWKMSYVILKYPCLFFTNILTIKFHSCFNRMYYLLSSVKFLSFQKLFIQISLKFMININYFLYKREWSCVGSDWWDAKWIAMKLINIWNIRFNIFLFIARPCWFVEKSLSPPYVYSWFPFRSLRNWLPYHIVDLK